MDVTRLTFPDMLNLKLTVAVGILACLQVAEAHDVFERWDPDVTPILCALVSESGWELEEKYQTYEPGPVTVRTFIGSFHSGAENTLAYLTDLDPYPFFINLQVVTSLEKRVNEVSVSEIEIQLGEDSVAPIVDTKRKEESLPVIYLGGSDAERFVEMLERNQSPVVFVGLSDSSSYEVPISTTGFDVARAMMATCMETVRKSTPD